MTSQPNRRAREGARDAGEARGTSLRPARRELVLVATAVVFALGVLSVAGPVTPGVPLAFWFVACLVGERLWVRLPLGGATLSMAACFNFAAALLLPLGDALVAVALATMAGEAWFMRKPALRVIFNAAQTLLSCAAASAALRTLLPAQSGPADVLAAFDLVPVLAAGLAYAVVNTGSVALAVAISEGIAPWPAWRRLFGSGLNLSVEGASLSLGVLVAVHVTHTGLVATAFALCPLVVAHQAYRMHLARTTRPDDDEQGARAA